MVAGSFLAATGINNLSFLYFLNLITKVKKLNYIALINLINILNSARQIVERIRYFSAPRRYLYFLVESSVSLQLWSYHICRVSATKNV
jgi:hypothetical protein